jgi:hypothetical protein
MRLVELDEDCKRCYGKEVNEIRTIYVRKKGAE